MASPSPPARSCGCTRVGLRAARVSATRRRSAQIPAAAMSSPPARSCGYTRVGLRAARVSATRRRSTPITAAAMSSPPEPPDAGDPATQPSFTDDIPSVVRFLRRFRPLNLRPVVGFLGHEGRTPLHSRPFYHAQPPHRSASPARTLAEAADFACSFLPDPDSWRLIDAAGCRLLLSSDSSDDTRDLDEDLVVCDPLHRRYVRIPPVPVDLTADAFTSTTHFHFQSFFAPTGQEEEGLSFRLIWMIYGVEETNVTAFVFSSATGQWHRVAFDGWEFDECIPSVRTSSVHTSFGYHAKISFHKSSMLFSKVLMLDTHKMEFSVVPIPLVRRGNSQQHAIVEAGEGRLGFLTVKDGMLDLSCKAWQDSGVSVEEWQHEKTIPIPLPDSDKYSISFCGSGDGYLLLQAIPPDSDELEQIPEIHYFSLHVKTLLVERLCMLNDFIDVALLYTNFPPLLSLPSV